MCSQGEFADAAEAILSEKVYAQSLRGTVCLEDALSS